MREAAAAAKRVREVTFSGCCTLSPLFLNQVLNMPAPREFDFQDVGRSMKNTGRAYQKRSVAMIELCRLFLEISPGNRDQVDALKSLVYVIDRAVERAVDARKDRSTDADNAFATAEKEMDSYAERYHPGHDVVLGDMQNIIRVAAKEDNSIIKSQGLSSWRSSREDTSSGHSSQVRVHFQILTSPTRRSNFQTLIFELGTEVKITELLWIFARLPVNHRIAPRDIPHFYLSKDLPDRPLTYTEEFKLEPLKDLRPENDQVVLVLLDHPRTGRIFFECGKFCKTYTNIWKPHDTVILKDLQGTIEAASRIGPMIQGGVRIWKRGTTHFPLMLNEWTEVLDLALHHDYLHVDWLIRTETSPSEAIAIEFAWECCSPIPRVPVQGGAPLSPYLLGPLSLSSQITPSSPSDPIAASNAVHSHSRTRTMEMLERQRQLVTPAPPLAQIPYSPLERLALSIEDRIEDRIGSTSGSMTSDANEILTPWPTSSSA
ncbi:hypothetical protein H4582DRAFT_1977502 [Lactarius indigo]|nr:hypothetical protein H4582DRAFT_1977502 [Lactarius indigo]